MKKKKVPVISLVLLILLIIIAGGIWYWNTHKKGIIRNKLESAIREKSNGLYKVHYDSLELDEINGSLTLSSFSLSYDSVKYNRIRKEKKGTLSSFLRICSSHRDNWCRNSPCIIGERDKRQTPVHPQPGYRNTLHTCGERFFQECT